MIDDSEEVSRIIRLLHSADLSEQADTARTAERQAWIGGPHRDDGIPISALGPLPTGPRTAVRDLGRAVAVGRDHAAFESAPTLAVLSTGHDKPVDWVRAGQALQRLLLEATGQEDLRWLVRSPLTASHLQIIMRLG
ncbi:MAG: hypothetical protein QOE19_1809 [Actinomycetota bacterium]|nr:hypothetical protein [Actinomycetota bacterium]